LKQQLYGKSASAESISSIDQEAAGFNGIAGKRASHSFGSALPKSSGSFKVLN
jgi:hypothetical protein